LPAKTVPDELIPAIGYIRVSLAREEMISPDLQRESILRWAGRTGHAIIDWVDDLDKTGRNFKRKIMAVIERIEGGEAKVIAVWKYSRFGRTRTGVPANLARVEKAGGQLISATEELDARTAIGRFQRGMIMEYNAFESDRAGEQWIETHEWRRSQGLPATGGKRFGYIWHPRKIYAPDGSITLQREFYEPDPETLAIARDLYVKYVAGAGFNRLATALNRDGVVTIRGNLWSDRSLAFWMDSGFAAGYLRVHDPACKVPSYRSTCPHILVKHPTKGHAPIISEELWRQYQARRNFTRTAPPHSRKAKYPLTGIGRCSLCGHVANRTQNRPGGSVSFVCASRQTKGTKACAGFHMPVRVVESSVKDWLAVLAGEIEAEAHGILPSPKLGQGALPIEQRRAKAKAEVDRLERAVAKHMRAYAMSEMEDPTGMLEQEYLDTLGDLRREKAAAAAALEALWTDSAGAGAQAEQLRSAAVSVAVGLVQEWDSMRPDRINTLLRQVISRIDLGPQWDVDIVPVWEQRELA
jgi:site-specific DNA recombinase